MNKPVYYENVDLSKLFFKKRPQSKTVTTGLTYDIGVNIGGKYGDLTMRLPKLYSGFGAQEPPEEYRKEDDEGYKFAIDYRLDADEKYDPTKETEKFRNFVSLLDNAVLDFIVKNSKEILGKEKVTKEGLIEYEVYKSLIRFSKKDTDKKYPSFRVKVPIDKTGKPKFDVISFETKKEISWCTLTEGQPPQFDWTWAGKNSNHVPLIKGYISVINGKVYCSWRAYGFLVYARVQQKLDVNDLYGDALGLDAPTTTEVPSNEVEEVEEVEEEEVMVDDEDDE